jgi:hypothetical protein
MANEIKAPSRIRDRRMPWETASPEQVDPGFRPDPLELNGFGELDSLKDVFVWEYTF